MEAQEIIIRVTLGISAMFCLYWLCLYGIIKPLKRKRMLSDIAAAWLSAAALYLPGLALFLLITKGIPAGSLQPLNLGVGAYVVVLAAQFFSVFIMMVFSTIEMKLLGSQPADLESAGNPQSGRGQFLILLLIPVLEEVLMRKLLGDRAVALGVPLFLVLSAFAFSLVHLQTGRLAVAAAMLYNGFLWAFLYAATGSLVLPVLYHILNNLVLTNVPERLKEKKGSKAHSVFMAGVAVIGVVGFIFLLINKNRYFPESWQAAMGEAWRQIFLSPGAWVLVVCCVLSFMLAKRFKQMDSMPDSAETHTA